MIADHGGGPLQAQCEGGCPFDISSVSIPAIFPPVFFKVDADGRRYEEIHVDGGPASQVFFYSACVVYVLDLVDRCMKLGGRCWVSNEDCWVTCCDLWEKTKLRVDQEGIELAFPQLELHFNPAK